MKVLITASRHDADGITNYNNNADLLFALENLKGVSVQRVAGHWQGTVETSYMFDGVTAEQLPRFMEQANRYNQDAVLVVTGDKRAHLYSAQRENGVTTWTHSDIGNWQQVDGAVAIQFDGYTTLYGESALEYYVAATPIEIAIRKRRLLATRAAVIAQNEYVARNTAVGV